MAQEPNKIPVPKFSSFKPTEKQGEASKRDGSQLDRDRDRSQRCKKSSRSDAYKAERDGNRKSQGCHRQERHEHPDSRTESHRSGERKDRDGRRSRDERQTREVRKSRDERSHRDKGSALDDARTQAKDRDDRGRGERERGRVPGEENYNSKRISSLQSSNGRDVTSSESPFFIDLKGDSLIPIHERTDPARTARFRRFGTGYVLGFSGVKPLRINPRESELGKVVFYSQDLVPHKPGDSSSLLTPKTTDPRQVRVLKARPLQNDKAQLNSSYISFTAQEPESKRSTNETPDNDYAKYSFTKLDGAERGYNEDTHESIDATSDSEDQKHDEHSDTELLHDDWKEQIKQSKIDLLRRTNEFPNDIEAWIKLTELQADIVAMERGVRLWRDPDPNGDASGIKKSEVNSSRYGKLTANERRNVTDIRISLLEKAMSRVSDTVRDRHRLFLRMIKEGVDAQIWDYRTLQRQWLSKIEVGCMFEDCFPVRLAYVDFLQSCPQLFRYDDVFAAYSSLFCRFELVAIQNWRKRRLETRFTYLGNKEDGWESKLLQLFVRFTRFAHEAGYTEFAVSLWQASLEAHLFSPARAIGELDSADDRIQAMSGFLDELEDWWDEEHPRVGEDNAAGWYSAEDTNYKPHSSWPEEVKIGNKDKPTHESIFSLAESEVRASQSKILPGRICDPKPIFDNHPFHTILFSEIRPFVRAIMWVRNRAAVLQAFLLFADMPPLCTTDPSFDLVRRCEGDRFLRGGLVKPSVTAVSDDPSRSSLDEGSGEDPLARFEETMLISSMFPIPFARYLQRGLFSFVPKGATWLPDSLARSCVFSAVHQADPLIKWCCCSLGQIADRLFNLLFIQGAGQFDSWSMPIDTKFLVTFQEYTIAVAANLSGNLIHGKEVAKGALRKFMERRSYVDSTLSGERKETELFECSRADALLYSAVAKLELASGQADRAEKVIEASILQISKCEYTEALLPLWQTALWDLTELLDTKANRPSIESTISRLFSLTYPTAQSETGDCGTSLHLTLVGLQKSLKATLQSALLRGDYILATATIDCLVLISYLVPLHFANSLKSSPSSQPDPGPRGEHTMPKLIHSKSLPPDDSDLPTLNSIFSAAYIVEHASEMVLGTNWSTGHQHHMLDMVREHLSLLLTQLTSFELLKLSKRSRTAGMGRNRHPFQVHRARSIATNFIFHPWFSNSTVPANPHVISTRAAVRTCFIGPIDELRMQKASEQKQQQQQQDPTNNSGPLASPYQQRQPCLSAHARSLLLSWAARPSSLPGPTANRLAASIRKESSRPCLSPATSPTDLDSLPLSVAEWKWRLADAAAAAKTGPGADRCVRLPAQATTDLPWHKGFVLAAIEAQGRLAPVGPDRSDGRSENSIPKSQLPGCTFWWMGEPESKNGGTRAKEAEKNAHRLWELLEDREMRIRNDDVVIESLNKPE